MCFKFEVNTSFLVMEANAKLMLTYRQTDERTDVHHQYIRRGSLTSSG